MCDYLRTLLFILPSYSTHRLQSFNVSLFASLTTFYIIGLNKLLNNSFSIISMIKRAFWSIFLPAWKEAFTLKNIVFGFEKTGIFPYKPRLILDVIIKPLPIEPPKLPKTPISYRAVRRAYRVYKFKPNSKYLSKIFRGHERAAVDRVIGIYIIKGL